MSQLDVKQKTENHDNFDKNSNIVSIPTVTLLIYLPYCLMYFLLKATKKFYCQNQNRSQISNNAIQQLKSKNQQP